MYGAPLDGWLNGSYVDVLLKLVVNVVLILWRVGPILRNRYGGYVRKVCYIPSGK